MIGGFHRSREALGEVKGKPMPCQRCCMNLQEKGVQLDIVVLMRALKPKESPFPT
jgi:hypothetical protein